MVGRDLFRPGGLYSAVRECDLVLDISAGDSFADIYGLRRFLFNLRLQSRCPSGAAPAVLSPQTIGPFERGWTRSSPAWLMRRADTIVSRDDLTTDSSSISASTDGDRVNGRRLSSSL